MMQWLTFKRWVWVVVNQRSVAHVGIVALLHVRSVTTKLKLKISLSQMSGVTKAVVCAILSVGWCI